VRQRKIENGYTLVTLDRKMALFPKKPETANPCFIGA
jgi:hypothetical protein